MSQQLLAIPRSKLPKCKVCRQTMVEIDTHYSIQNEQGINDVYLFICRKHKKGEHLCRQKVMFLRDDDDIIIIPINNYAALSDADISLGD